MTKSTKKLNTQEVKDIRAKNAPVVFNIEAALKEVENTPMKAVKSGALGALSGAIKDIVLGAGGPVSVAQVRAALQAGGMEIPNSKTVSDKIWGLANGKNPCLKMHPELKGVYMPIDCEV